VKRDVDGGAQVDEERRSCHKNTAGKRSPALRTPSFERLPRRDILPVDHCDKVTLASWV
jgi:hypothetical protein